MQKNKTISTILGVNQQALNIATAKNRVSEQCYQQAKGLVSDFCPITDEALFRSGFTAYVTAFIKKDKYLSLIDIKGIFNIDSLYKIEQRYNEYRVTLDGVIDPTAYNYIATTSEQLKALDYATALCKQLNEHPQVTELIHHLRNTSIPLVLNNYEGFSVDLGAICLL